MITLPPGFDVAALISDYSAMCLFFGTCALAFAGYRLYKNLLAFV